MGCDSVLNGCAVKLIFFVGVRKFVKMTHIYTENELNSLTKGALIKIVLNQQAVNKEWKESPSNSSDLLPKRVKQLEVKLLQSE